MLIYVYLLCRLIRSKKAMLGGAWLLGSINDVEERAKQRHKA